MHKIEREYMVKSKLVLDLPKIGLILCISLVAVFFATSSGTMVSIQKVKVSQKLPESTTSTPIQIPVQPQQANVSGSRFIIPTELDNGDVVIDPASLKSTPKFTLNDLISKFGENFPSPSHPVIVGYGLVTVADKVSLPEVKPQPPTTYGESNLPKFKSELAWVELMQQNGAINCPFIKSIPGKSPPTVPAQWQSLNWTVLIVDANSGTKSLLYKSPSDFCEMSVGAEVTTPYIRVSIQWNVEQGSGVLEAYYPYCASTDGYSFSGNSRNQTGMLSVTAVVPGDLPAQGCLSSGWREVTSAPSGFSGVAWANITHLPVGPISWNSI
ncbi:MAG: hypothetical protein HKL80_01450 [Acidimicrobiales bacterium]|nr:hypothetical protein [Acidimicrobiales bacterium]